MRILVLSARILLGAMFAFFGSNGFLQFLPRQLPPGPAGDFIGSMLTSHYIYLVAATQVVAGILLLINRYVLLALALLAPMIANILMFHLTMAPAPIQLAIVALVLWAFLFWRYRAHFACLWASRADFEK